MDQTGPNSQDPYQTRSNRFIMIYCTYPCSNCTLCVYEFSLSKLKLLNDQIKKNPFSSWWIWAKEFFLVNQNFTYNWVTETLTKLFWNVLYTLRYRIRETILWKRYMFVYYLSYHYIYGANATGQKNAYELRKLLPWGAHLKKQEFWQSIIHFRIIL